MKIEYENLDGPQPPSSNPPPSDAGRKAEATKFTRIVSNGRDGILIISFIGIFLTSICAIVIGGLYLSCSKSTEIPSYLIASGVLTCVLYSLIFCWCYFELLKYLNEGYRNRYEDLTGRKTKLHVVLNAILLLLSSVVGGLEGLALSRITFMEESNCGYIAMKSVSIIWWSFYGLYLVTSIASSCFSHNTKRVSSLLPGYYGSFGYTVFDNHVPTGASEVTAEFSGNISGNESRTTAAYESKVPAETDSSMVI